MARMRTLAEAHSELVAADPGCCLTKTALRRLVVSGAVRAVMVGRKYLVDMDNLGKFLEGSTVSQTVQPHTGGIRRVEM